MDGEGGMEIGVRSDQRFQQWPVWREQGGWNDFVGLELSGELCQEATSVFGFSLENKVSIVLTLRTRRMLVGSLNWTTP